MKFAKRLKGYRKNGSLFVFCYVQEEKTLGLFAAVAKLKSAAAEKQGNQEN